MKKLLFALLLVAAAVLDLSADEARDETPIVQTQSKTMKFTLGSGNYAAKIIAAASDFANGGRPYTRYESEAAIADATGGEVGRFRAPFPVDKIASNKDYVTFEGYERDHNNFTKHYLTFKFESGTFYLHAYSVEEGDIAGSGPKSTVHYYKRRENGEKISMNAVTPALIEKLVDDYFEFK